jgi:hypothetical protein
MGADGQHHSLGANAFAWFLNVSSAVTIVFVNKVLMDQKKGYAFTFGKCAKRCSTPSYSNCCSLEMPAQGLKPIFFAVCVVCLSDVSPAPCCALMCAVSAVQSSAACTLSAIHFLTAAASVIGAQVLGFAEKAKLPLRGEAAMLWALWT